MKHVNFLSKEPSADEVKKTPFELNYLWILGISVGILVIASGFSYIQKKRIDSRQAQVAMLAEENHRKKSEAAAKQGLSVPKSGDSLMNHPISWAELLHDIDMEWPTSAQLVSIRGSLLDKRLLTVEAEANHLGQISIAQKNLRKIRSCNTIHLASVKQVNVENGPRYTFSLECNIQ